MAHWTDKDIFELVHYKPDTYYHAIRPGVRNDLKQYAHNGDVLPIVTNGDVITQWWSDDYINARAINRIDLADMIRDTKPNANPPILVVTIPEIERADIGMVVWCWMRLNSEKTMQLARYDGTYCPTTFEIPPSDKDRVNGFGTNTPIRSIGTPCIYYDWREALTPITNYFKAVIKYCKDTGKARRLADEAAVRALNSRNETIRTLAAKNSKRFKNIEF